MPTNTPITIPFSEVHLAITRELPNAGNVEDILRSAGLGKLSQEVLWVIPYDSTMGVRAIIEVARGGYHNLVVPIPAILAPVFLAATDRFIVAHNHSSGALTPTLVDMDLTRKVMDAANTCGLYFEDHLILGPRAGQSYSMFDHNLIKRAGDLVTLSQVQAPIGYG